MTGILTFLTQNWFLKDMMLCAGGALCLAAFVGLSLLVWRPKKEIVLAAVDKRIDFPKMPIPPSPPPIPTPEYLKHAKKKGRIVHIPAKKPSHKKKR